MADVAPTGWRIGTSGWSYPDWNGIVYPVKRGRGFSPLRQIASTFNAVEVNSTFYAIPAPRVTAAWPALTPEGFRFAVKVPQLFTHVEPRVVDPVQVTAFGAALAPLAEATRLGPLLIQFPWSFRYSTASADHLARLADAFGEYERFVEVRHSSWASEAALAAIRSAGGYCNIDQPVLRDCLGPTEYVFGRNAYVRLHGRNAATWFAEGLPPFERYNYLYDEAELREWVRRLLAIRAQAEEVYAFTNNHYRGQGVANALELMALLGMALPRIPEELHNAYPSLATFPTTRKSESQSRLF